MIDSSIWVAWAGRVSVLHWKIGQQICMFFAASLKTPCGQWLCWAPQLQPSLKILRMWFIISLLHRFFVVVVVFLPSWGLALNAVSGPPNNFLGLVRDTSLEWGESLYTWVPSMWKFKRCLSYGVQPLECFEQWGHHWKMELNLSLSNPWSPLHVLSLNERHFRCGEKLKWKLLHQNISFGGGGRGRGGVFGKILIFFKEQREVDESIWGYNDQSLHCLPSLPNASSKMEKINEAREMS